jgi:hypothetical protein
MLSFLLMAIMMQTLLNGPPEKGPPVQEIQISAFAERSISNYPSKPPSGYSWRLGRKHAT